MPRPCLVETPTVEMLVPPALVAHEQEAPTTARPASGVRRRASRESGDEVTVLNEFALVRDVDFDDVEAAAKLEPITPNRPFLPTVVPGAPPTLLDAAANRMVAVAVLIVRAVLRVGAVTRRLVGTDSVVVRSALILGWMAIWSAITLLVRR